MVWKNIASHSFFYDYSIFKYLRQQKRPYNDQLIFFILKWKYNIAVCTGRWTQDFRKSFFPLHIIISIGRILYDPFVGTHTSCWDVFCYRFIDKQSIYTHRHTLKEQHFAVDMFTIVHSVRSDTVTTTTHGFWSSWWEKCRICDHFGIPWATGSILRLATAW